MPSNVFNLPNSYASLNTGDLFYVQSQTGIVGEEGSLNFGTLLTLIVAGSGANFTTQGNIFNGPNLLVQLDANNALPAADGHLLTNLPSQTNISLLTTGTINTGQMPGGNFNNAGQVPLLDANGAMMNIPLNDYPFGGTNTGTNGATMHPLSGGNPFFAMEAGSNVASAEVRTLAPPSFIGQQAILYYFTGTNGSSTINVACPGGFDNFNNHHAKFTNFGDFLGLIAVFANNAISWRGPWTDGADLQP